MADSKPYASLSSGLLARKGGAKPAMRPQGFNNYGGSFEDLGWNDMGHVEEELPHHVPSPVGLTPPPRSHIQAAPPVQEVPLEAFEREDEAFEAAAGDEESFDEPHNEEFHEEPYEEACEEEVLEEPAPVAPPLASAPVAPPRAPVAPPVPRAPPVVVEQQRALRESFAEAEVVSLPRRRAAPSNLKAKAAFTLRLDPERHLKLRLASAVTRMSAQQLVTGALDDFLNSLPELDALADRLPAEAGQRRS
ncbi:MAG: hypothetical protein JWO81_2165 [Alphaproteobacteria bacterium]|nr:hypothetical protein [Alphaproteobacteria bacterium]